MNSTIQNGMVEYTGFDSEDNGKWLIDRNENEYTYVNYQRNEFTQVIWGYVVKQDDGRYKAFQFGDRNVKYFDNVDDGIDYIKSLSGNR